MGRMLEALKQAETRRKRPAELAPAPRPYQPEKDEECSVEQSTAEEEAVEEESLATDASEVEIPFIEVGGPNHFEASASVMAVAVVRPPLYMPPNSGMVRSDAPSQPPTPRAHHATHPADDAQAIRVVPVPTPTEPAVKSVEFRPYPVPPPPLPPAQERFASELVTFHRPEHPVSKHYQDLIVAVTAQPPTPRAQVLLFTAASAGAGTTTALLNLAICASRENRRKVVVVDADLRKPGVAKRLGLPLAPGLQEVLAGAMSLQRALQETGQPNLSALTAGETTGRLQLAGEAMRAVLRHLRSRFDLVFVDTMPWDGRPDVVALGTACDAVYLVVRHGEQQDPQVTDLLHLIPQQGSKLCGCILTHL